MAAGKKAGRHSAQANDFLEPYAPINVVATDIGTSRPYNDGAVSVSFSLPGDSPAATSYAVTLSSGQSASGASSPIIVTGVSSGASVTATVIASNSSGNSLSSSASSAVTVTTVPQTPSAPTASSPSGANYDTVTWSEPNNGGKAITGYSWESSDSKSGTTANTSVNVTQEAGTSQTYRVKATNANGSSEFSSYSGSVTTFSFVPFSVFGFFGVFGFFSVFGFFGVFSFTWSDSFWPT